MLGKPVKLTFKTAFRFVLQLIGWIFWIYTFGQGPDYVDIIFTRRAAYDYPLPIALFQVIVLCQILGYTTYGTYIVYKYKSEESNIIMQAKVNRLKQFMHLLVILAILIIICFVLFENADNDYIYVPLLYMVFYCMVVYKSFQSFGVFPDSSHIINVREEVVQEEMLRKEKYVNSALNPQQIQEFKTRLLLYLDENEPYTNPDLSIAGLAVLLDLSPHQLSQGINQAFDNFFSELINGYRVEKSKVLLNDPASSALYRAFKKNTGITPKAFLNK